MKRFLFAAALAALFATSASADDKPATGTAPAAPAVTAAPVEMAPAAPARRGLLARLRDRRSGTTMSAPVMTAPAAPATPMPGTTPAPMPMPGSKTTGTGITPAGGTTTTGDVVTTVGYTETTSKARRGLFSRLRNR